MEGGTNVLKKHSMTIGEWKMKLSEIVEDSEKYKEDELHWRRWEKEGFIPYFRV